MIKTRYFWEKILRSFFRHIFLLGVAFLVILPFFWMVISSFKSNTEVFDNSHFLPIVWRYQNYPEALNKAPFGIFFLNSVFITFVSVIAQLITCSLSGFAFAKIKFKYRKVIFMMFLACLMIPSQATIISNYITISNLGLVNTYLGILLVSLTSVFGIFLMRQFFLTVPNEFMEAASIDGCSLWKTFIRIFIPMGKSAMATVGVFGVMNSWNDYMWPLVVTSSNRYKTVQTGIRYLISDDLGAQWGYIMAMSTVIVLPVVVIFIFLQRYFIQGITKVGLK